MALRRPRCDPDSDGANSGTRGVLPVSMAIFAILVLATHLVSSRPGLSWMWGAHFYGFFPVHYLYLATAFVACATLLLILHGQTAANITRILSRGLSGGKLWIAASASVLAGTCLFWVLRICHTYLGDGEVVVQEVGTYHHVLEREPLTSFLQYSVYGMAKPHFSPDRLSASVAQDAVALGSVVAGFLFLANAWVLASELSRLGDTRSEDRRPIMWLLWLVLVTQGYVQLFFGYVENYSFLAAGIVLFLAVSLRYLRGACALLWPALALCVCVMLHFSSVLLGLPFLVLACDGLRARARRAATVRDLVVSCLVATAAVVLALQQYNPLQTFVGMFRTAFTIRRDPAYALSAPHFRDFLNEQILIGPLGMFLFLGAAVYVIVRRRVRHRAAVFALVAGLTVLATSWMIGDSNLGYARDWDLLSHTGIVFVTAGLALVLLVPTPRSALVATLVIGMLISIYHTVPWVATNAGRTASLARLETLPLGLGRTEVMLATWHADAGDETTQREWLLQSIAANSANASAYYQLGVLDMKQRAYGDAITSFQQTVALRPDKLEFRGRLAHAYYLADRFPEAATDLEFIVGKHPANTMAVFYLGESLEQAGRIDEARVVFMRAEWMSRDAMDDRPDDSDATAVYGWVQFRLGCVDDALTTLSRATDLAPTSSTASCYLGYVLHDLQRDDDARSSFEACLDGDTEVPTRRRIAAWLSNTAPLLVSEQAEPRR